MSKTTVACVDINGLSHDTSIEELRWRPSIYAIVIREGKILLAQEEGFFSLPGGGINLGELPEAALQREVKEETGLEIVPEDIVAMKSSFFILPDSNKGQFIQSILLYYKCRYESGELSIENVPASEKHLHQMPVWCDISKVHTLPVHGSVDWRKFVRET